MEGTREYKLLRPLYDGSREGWTWRVRTTEWIPSAPTRISQVSVVPSAKVTLTDSSVSSIDTSRLPMWTAIPASVAFP